MSSATLPAVHAAGALVWRVAGAHIEVMLVHRPRYDDWSWPKGKRDPGESLPACAVREVAEETGLAVVLGQPLPGVRYRLDDGRLKVCHYWAARVANAGSPAIAARAGAELGAEDEVDGVAWVRSDRARALLTRASDRAPLDALVDLWDEGALDTRAFVVLRHARAKKRSAWPGGETTRPLTAVGLRQAGELVATLSAFGVERVASSPWERCRATVAPFAFAAGVGVLDVEEITEESAKRRASGARRAIAALLAELRPKRRAELPPEGLVVCTHRPVLPAVLEEIAAVSPNRVRELLPHADPYLRAGEMLVAHVLPRHRRGIRVLVVERHRS